MILLYLLLHVHGSQFEYAHNPFGEWLQQQLNQPRNHYDRIGLVSTGAPAGAPAAPHELEIVAAPGPTALRLARPGDRMRPARLRGRSRKLSDLYVDARVPRADRARARVIVDPATDEILWAEHLGPAHGIAIEVVVRASPVPAQNPG